MSAPRDPNTMFVTEGKFSRDLAAIAATGTFAIATPHPVRAFRVERVELIVDATYAADPANFYAMTVQVGATVVASWSTQTSAQGAITGGTPAAMVLSGTDANLVVAGAGVLSFVATKNGTAANITPRVVVHGRYVS